ncbi:MAG: gephyrin-like molybdotransferase Glp [Myxococcota bacterium]
MLSVDEARATILDTVQVGRTELLALMQASGRVLAEPVRSTLDHPPFDNSAMDGYAVRWDEVCLATPTSPVTMPVAMDIPAGSYPEPLPLGHVARIMTGAPMPEGADTVVVREDTDESDRAQILISGLPAGAGAHIRRRGENLAEGAQVLDRGTLLGAGEVGLLAILGKAMIPVIRRPKVAIISTGDELVNLGEQPGPGQIVNSSGPMLAAMVADAGGEPWLLPIARDTYEATQHCFRQALDGADLVISIGGVSVGDFDVVKQVLEELCDGLSFWKIRMKPGKPLAFGRGPAGTPLVGLPGNPVSSWVSFLQFVRPALRKMLGLESWVLPTVQATLMGPVRSPASRLDLQRGQLAWASTGAEVPFVFTPHPNQGSGNPTSLLSVGGLARIPVGCSQLDVGAVVTVEVVGALHGVPIRV